MTAIGYARVSTTDQDLDTQITALQAAGCKVIRSEKVSGASREGRTELQTVLDFLRPGDASQWSGWTGCAIRLVLQPHELRIAIADFIHELVTYSEPRAIRT